MREKKTSIRLWGLNNLDIMRQKHVDEMERIKRIIKNTDSTSLKRDLIKHLYRMEKDLKEYDKYRGYCNGKRAELATE